MDSILQQITDWLKEMLISAIMGNLSGMFESVNNQVGEIATSVGRTPESFSPEIFAMVRNISESVIIPIAGLILTFIACYELIQLIIDHNNLANFETWIFFKWVFKTFVAVMLITNTFNITMAVFDVAQHVVNASGGIIAGNTAIVILNVFVINMTATKVLNTHLKKIQVSKFARLLWSIII